ncbi:putative mediator of RNA polymerase II transcription subunit 26 [Macrosteles quadrilineatus]|uniref:putative mediator of RNA polymerase II transcription subunit 26 n=1 Tax=Macrosteles quadrilineatus TaxID=74068 RepID=UPI0023E29308|nr:putative mediator of RNA polymerase II transcription subunit 26 [Macrosteles quadrilineatus]
MDCYLFFAILLTSVSISYGYTNYQNGFKPIQKSYHPTAEQEEERYEAYANQPAYPPSPGHRQQAGPPLQPTLQAEAFTYPEEVEQDETPNYQDFKTQNEFYNYPAQSDSFLPPKNQAAVGSGERTPYAGGFGLRKHPRYPAPRRKMRKNQRKRIENFGRVENHRHFQRKKYAPVQKHPQHYTEPEHTQSQGLDSKIVENRPNKVGRHRGKHHIDYHDSHPKYNYEYKVHDPNTGDFKSHNEERDGDSVQGKYEVVEPTGARRIVHYTSDKNKGFVAVVHTEPITHILPQKPENYKQVSYEQPEEEQPEYEHSQHDQQENLEQTQYTQPSQYKRTFENVKSENGFQPTKGFETPVHEEQEENLHQQTPQLSTQLLEPQDYSQLQQWQQIYSQSRQKQQVYSQLQKDKPYYTPNQQVISPLQQGQQTYAQLQQNQQVYPEVQQEQQIHTPLQKNKHFQSKPDQQTYSQPPPYQKLYSEPQQQQIYSPLKPKQPNNFPLEENQQIYPKPQQKRKPQNSSFQKKKHHDSELKPEQQVQLQPQQEQQFYSQSEQEHQIYPQPQQNQQPKQEPIYPKQDQQDDWPKHNQLDYFESQKEPMSLPLKQEQGYSNAQQNQQFYPETKQEDMFPSFNEEPVYSTSKQEKQANFQPLQKKQISPQPRRNKTIRSPNKFMPNKNRHIPNPNKKEDFIPYFNLNNYQLTKANINNT